MEVGIAHVSGVRAIGGERWECAKRDEALFGIERV